MLDEVTIRLEIEPVDGDCYVATSPDVPGLVAEGRSLTEVCEIAQGLARRIAESCLEHGDPLPEALRPLVNKPTKISALVPVGVR